jgi:hypothetical protein
VGVDIHGWIEVNWYLDHWVGVVKIDSITPRSYDMFGSLFGVMNFANFQPIAANRALPQNLSMEATRELLEWNDEWGPDPLWPTWISAAELRSIDWDEAGEKSDDRIHRYKRLGEELIYDGKGRMPDGHPTHALVEGQSLEIDGVVFVRERIRRRDARNGEWDLLFTFVNLLVEPFEEQKVRLVVWFDR